MPRRPDDDPDGTTARPQERTVHQDGPAEGQGLPGRLRRRPAIEYRLARGHEHALLGALSTAAAGLTPGVDVLRRYRRGWLRHDVFAGVAVAAYLVPQVMAYAAIVDLPPVTGLWTALAGIVGYAVLGGSRVLSVGPESTVALMAAAAIAPLAAGDASRAMALTAALSLVVAGWCAFARLLRLGVVADLLSQPLLVGYLAGGAVLMVVGQLGRLTGTEVEGESILAQLRSFVDVVGATHWPTLAVGLGTLVLLLTLVALRPRWPAPLVAVVAATAVCAVTGLNDHGVAVVGPVPTGLPVPHLPAVSWDDVRSLLVAGLGVAVVAYGDNTLIGRGFPAPVDDDRSKPPQIDPQQELVALSGVHAAVGLVGGFPVSSSGSRTALALAAGARSQLYSLVCAGCVVVVLVAAGPLIEQLPKASLGAVVVYAAGKLVSWQDFRRLARFRSNELVLALACTVGTVGFGILTGIAVAIALSLLEMAQRLARPHEGVLGRVPGLAGMHDVDDYPDAQTLPGLVIYRYDAPLFFANACDLRRRALLVVEQENQAYPEHPVRWFVLNVEANVEIDITAADELTALYHDLAAKGVRLGLARVKRDLRRPLERAGLAELIGEDMLFPTLPVAEEAYLTWAAEHPAGEHPACEHPAGEHPAGDGD
jgi:SulP family sulfate permease